jgi:hypothetical protein
MMHRLSALLFAGVLGAATNAQAGVYVTGSISNQETTMPYSYVNSQYGSASVDFDLGRYVRLGYTYGIQKSQTDGYTDPAQDPLNPNGNPNCSGCGKTSNMTTEVDHSIGATIILYDGQVFMPFLLGGIIDKFVTVEGTQYSYANGGAQLVPVPPHTSSSGPEPYGGGGLGIRLNRDFMLKFSYQVSKAVSQVPGEPPKGKLDARSTVGLTYQFL